MTRWTIVLAVLFALTTGCQRQPNNGDVSMNQDEQAIRRWFDEWMKATKEGDLELARTLIADDAIFLVPGAGQMDKESFAAAATATDPNTEFELDCTIQEIETFGDHAWLLATISLAMTDKTSDSRSLMKGDSLSVLHRRGDSWVVVRDANTMVSVESE